MIPRRTNLPPTNYLRTPSPDPPLPEPSIASDCEADDEDTMSMEDIRPSPPSSNGVDSDHSSLNGPYHPQRPTLPDVLSNSAPPPWTLSAFTAYLSQNHCLENLEFTLDAERYKEKYDILKSEYGAKTPPPDLEASRHLRMLWQRIIDAYIRPDCPREINIPSDARDKLLALPNKSAPPNPNLLGDAVKIIYNLMEESVLIPFLNEVPPSTKAINIKQAPMPIHEGHRRKRHGSESSTEKRSVHSRSKSKRRGSPSSSRENFSPVDPTGRLTPGSTKGASRRARSGTLNTTFDADSLTDDSGGALSPGTEPMTPPETPPQSDFGGSSPRNRSDLTWKKMLGWKKKSSATIRDTC